MLGQRRQPALPVVAVGGGVVGVLDVGLEEPVEVDDLAGRAELGPLARAGRARHPDRHRLAGGVLHLGGDGTLPDQLVQPPLVARRADPARPGPGCGSCPGGPDGLVRFLRVLDLARVGPRRIRHVGGAVQLGGLLAGRADRRLRERHRVGAHIGDVAVLVQPLRDGHGVLGREAELAGGLLLERRGAERRVGRAPVGLALHAGHREAGPLQPPGQGGGGGRVQVQDVRAAQLAGGGEITALGHPAAVDADQAGGKARRLVGVGLAVLGGRELRLEVSVTGGAEGDPLALPVHHQPGCHRLHAPGGQPGHDLLPQHGRDLVPVEPVQHAARLIGVHQALVHLARVGDGPGDRFGGDLVEDHPAVRHLGLELLEQVPGDSLALAVLISGQQQFVGILQQVLELGHLLPLVAVHDVQRLEVVIDVDPEPGPRLLAVLGRDLGGAVRHVADVADTGLDHVAVAEVARLSSWPWTGDSTMTSLVPWPPAGRPTGCRLGAAAALALRRRPAGCRLRLRRYCPCWHAIPVLASAP